MHILRRFALVGLATFAIVIVACGGGGDGGFELPPAGVQRFTVTGTMEVEFLEEGVSAGPIALQETETGELSGSLTSMFNEDGSFTITELGITVDFGDKTITITQAREPSSGNVGPEGTTVSLNVEAALDSDEPVPSETPLELESDDKLGVDSSVRLATPEDADPNAGLASEAGFIIHQIILLIEQEEETVEVPPDDAQTSFPDPEGDEVFCDTGEGANDPAVDIRSVFATRPGRGFALVRVVLGEPPTETFDDFSFAVVVSVNDIGGQAQTYDGVDDLGLLDSNGNVQPGTEESVEVRPDGVYMSFPGPVGPGETFNVQTIHLGSEGEMTRCDEASFTLP